MNDNTNRIGIGYDIHRLVEGRPLILGGITIPFEKGLLGHSDSDVLTHAICDALLGAAALGDLGSHFPDTDPKFKGASSLDLLREVVGLIAGRWLRVISIDSVIIAEEPKMAPHIPGMKDQLASILRIDRNAIGIKAKTNEGLGPIGEGNAMACQAVALLAPLIKN